MKTKLLQLFNLILLLVNGLAFYVGPQLGHHVEGNAAGILALAALIAVILWVVHFGVLCLAYFKSYTTFLAIFTVVMLPLSIYLWFFTFGTRL